MNLRAVAGINMIKNQVDLNFITNRGLEQRSFNTNRVFVLSQIIIANDLSERKKNEENSNKNKKRSDCKVRIMKLSNKLLL